MKNKRQYLIEPLKTVSNGKMKNEILISNLPLITDPEVFFSTDKILSVDVVCIDEAPGLVKLKLEIKKKAFRHLGKLYMPILLKGSPENLIIEGKKGIPSPYDVEAGFQQFNFFDGDLVALLKAKKVYYLSEYYYRMKAIEFAYEVEFLIER